MNIPDFLVTKMVDSSLGSDNWKSKHNSFSSTSQERKLWLRKYWHQVLLLCQPKWLLIVYHLKYFLYVPYNKYFPPLVAFEICFHFLTYTLYWLWESDKKSPPKWWRHIKCKHLLSEVKKSYNTRKIKRKLAHLKKAYAVPNGCNY